VCFDWVAPDGARGQGVGTSRDVSECGAFVFARRIPPVGATVNLWIGFRGAQATSRLRRLEVSGKSVRGEVHWERSEPCGFAVAGKTKVLNTKAASRNAPDGRAVFRRA
jgi:hypothetical protein